MSSPSGRTKWVSSSPSSSAFSFISCDESPGAAVADVSGQCERGVVGALDQGGGEEVADRELLAGREEDGRAALADGPGRDGDHVTRARVLERDERGHQLRDARHGHAAVGVLGVEHVARAPVRDDHGPRLDRRRRGGRGGQGDDERGGSDREQSEDAQGHGPQAITRDGMAEAKKDDKPARIRGVERSFQVRVGELGGFELRPTRMFVWAGGERKGHERVLPLGSPPKSLTIPRRPREIRAGALEMKTLGNPLMTIALAGVHSARALRRKITD